MLLANSDLISQRPAQLYYSVLPFLPSDTYLSRQYPTPRGCISVLAGRENPWTLSLFTLPDGNLTASAFAPGGHMFAIGRRDGIHIYNASNGLLNSSISSEGFIGPHLAAFTEDECGVVGVSSEWSDDKVSYHIKKFDLVKQNGPICRTTPCDDFYLLKLSEYGSYVAFAEHKNMGTRICIWKTDGGDDTSIPLGCAGKVHDLDLAGESAHLVAVVTEDITILSIPSGDVQRTLYHEGAEYVCISRDGSFLASWIDLDEARLWSITQGTLLATFPTEYSSPVFSHTNRLYVADVDFLDRRRVYDTSPDPDRVSIKSFTLPSPICILPHYGFEFILPMPDESRILIRTSNNFQVCSLKFTDHTRNAPRHDIEGIDLSGDASLLLALATRTGIEIWDARIGQRLHVVQSRSTSWRPVAFSPKGDLIVSDSEDGIIVVDVRAGGLLRTAYLFSPQGWVPTRFQMLHVGISSDSSKLAAINRWPCGLIRNPIYYLCVWDLPSGTLLHSLECGDIHEIQWS